MIRMKGGQVIGLTSSNDKAAVAKQMGADHVFLYGLDWVESIKDVTGGKGVDVVYESVGQTLMEVSLRPRLGELSYILDGRR